MEFTGLIKAYDAKRQLTKQEIKHQLYQKQKLNVQPYYQLSVIEMNSTYLESVDKWFGWKGAISILATIFLALGLGSFGLAGTISLLEAAGILESLLSSRPSTGVLVADGLAMWAVAAMICWLGIWMLRKDSFAYTHYPIRFNRKSRMVYVFRNDGTVLSVRWDDIFFTLSHFKDTNEWEVRGHVLDDDKSTVLETFALSYIGAIQQADASTLASDEPVKDYVRGHWEFIRRYMEDEIAEIQEHVKLCMPVNYRKETVRESFERSFANFAALPGLIHTLLIPLFALIAVFRIIGMRTSKIPA